MTNLGQSWLWFEWNWPSALGPPSGLNGSVNGWLPELHLSDVGNKEDDQRAEAVCLTSCNLRSSEKPYRPRFIQSTKSAVKMCHSTVPAGLVTTVQSHGDTTSQPLSSCPWLWPGTEVARAGTGSVRQRLLLAPHQLHLSQGPPCGSLLKQGLFPVPWLPHGDIMRIKKKIQRKGVHF